MKFFQKIMNCYLFFLMIAGCSPQVQKSVFKQRPFYQPPFWQKPISKEDIEDNTVITDNSPKEQRFYMPENFQPNLNHLNTSNNSLQTSISLTHRAALYEPQKPTVIKETNTSPNEQMEGEASWYGPGFHGQLTSSGERYNQWEMTAAHKILPMGTTVRVTNQANQKSVIVKINDRGPYKKNRILDLSRKAATELGFFEKGLAHVNLTVIKYPSSYDPSQGLQPYKQVVIQMASFKERNQANFFLQKLQGKLPNMDFKIEQPYEGLYRVLVGPFNNKDHAKSISYNLKQSGINNFIRSYRK